MSDIIDVSDLIGVKIYTESKKLKARKQNLSDMLTKRDVDEYEHHLVVEHMNSLTYGWTSPNAENKLREQIFKYGYLEVIRAIDIASKYLDVLFKKNEPYVTETSVRLFYSKITGILYNRNVAKGEK